MPSFYRFFLAAALLLSWAAPSLAQTLEHRPPSAPKPPVVTQAVSSGDAELAPAPLTLSQGTNLQVELTRHYPMKVNQAVEGRLLHPIYVQGKLAVPENTLLHGKVAVLKPDSKRRWHARLQGDFTPFHAAQIQFDALTLPSGQVAIASSRAENGAPVLHLAAPGHTTSRSLLGRAWSQTKTQLHDRITYFTAPGRGDRALQLLYQQLPYHPERIEAHTLWSFELTAPLQLPDTPAVADPPASAVAPIPGKPETWSINASLTAGLSSATAKPGDAVQALVVEPVFDKEKQLVVPQGSVLVGKVSTVKAARSLGRNGKLRFIFQQVRFPEGADRAVQGSLAGATTASQQGLSLDAEGTITPRNHSSVITPLLLTALAGRALDGDGNMTAQSGVAANGFGFVGRIVGVAAGSQNLAAGIGYYAAALSVYENFLHSGTDVTFAKNTRIEIETTPLRAPVLTPASQ